MLTFDNKTFIHEWLSLSEGTFAADRAGRARARARAMAIWSPSEPGVAFRVVPDAPVPAATAVERLRQMRTLAAKFSATYTAQHLDNKPFELRLLTQPIFRYETDDDSRSDGTLFVFVQSTASVALLLLESRPTRDGRRWHYAFASLVSAPVTASCSGKEIASIEKDYSRQDRTRPYLRLDNVPVPRE